MTDKPAKPKPAAKRGQAKSKGKAAKPRTVKASIGLAPAAFVDSMSAGPESGRNERGQFIQGSSGNPNGRPPGAKSRLCEDFIEDFHAAWRNHGAGALETIATSEASAFVRAAVQLMPKDVLLDARGAGLIVVRLDDVDMNL
jgi:hypothetical protein